MFKSIQIKNFGKIKDFQTSFSPGLNIIRGPNEAGKSTLIEAALYAMFGSTALRGTIDDVQNPAGKLEVKLEFDNIQVKRTKTSATLIAPDTKISGAGNVANYFYDLFQIPKGTEKDIFISSQGETAGLINQKPAVLSHFIASIAGFDQIDDLIESAKKVFPTGNKVMLGEMLDKNKTQLKELDQTKFNDVSGHLQELKDLEAKLKELDEKIETEIVVKRTIEIKQKTLSDQWNAYEQIKSQIENAKTALNLYTQPVPQIDDTDSKQYIEQYQKLKEDYNTWKKLQEYPDTDVYWEGSYGSLQDEIAVTKKSLDKLQKNAAKLKAEINQQHALINEMDQCPTCGQDVRHLYKDINAKAQARIKELVAEFETVTKNRKDRHEELQTLFKIDAAQQDRVQFKEYCLDQKIIPWPLRWKGPAPEKPDQKQFDQAMDVIRKATEARIKEQNRIQNYEMAERQLKELVLPPKPEVIPDFAPVQLNKLKQDKVKNLNEQKRLESILSEEETRRRDYKLKKKNLQEEQKDLRERLKSEERNTYIISALKKARPKVINQLWDRILVFTSRTFSLLRNKESVMTRDEKRFLVNGRSVGRLSGSAKAVLGIALRITLRDIFSSADFMIFDEPAASCDLDRTASVVSALKQIQGQVILITHEEVSDAIADKIIEL